MLLPIFSGLLLAFALRIGRFDRRQETTTTTCWPHSLAFQRLQGVCSPCLRPHFMSTLIGAASNVLKECYLLSKYHNILIIKIISWLKLSFLSFLSALLLNVFSHKFKEQFNNTPEKWKYYIKMKSSSNRKPIPLKRILQPQKKKTILSNFQPDLNQNIQSYLHLQRQKLRNLDKATVKKIIGTAEKSLMNFMRSKAKINCFKQKDCHYQSYTTLPVHTHSSPQNIFDPKKLEIEIEHEQRKFRQAASDNSPLIDFSLRQVMKEDSARLTKSTNWTHLVKQNKTLDIYCPYSAKKRPNKMIYF